jgi:hypothetical protein
VLFLYILQPSTADNLDFDVKDEQAPRFSIQDACFGLKHRRLAGNESLKVVDSGVDLFVNVDFRPLKEIDNCDNCDNWTAGEGRGQSRLSDASALDVYGQFASCCRHQTWQAMCDVVTPGERFV